MHGELSKVVSFGLHLFSASGFSTVSHSFILRASRDGIFLMDFLQSSFTATYFAASNERKTKQLEVFGWARRKGEESLNRRRER